jgi:hypothetical protein
MRKLYLFLVLLNLAILISCKENTLKPISSDGVPPGKVEILSVTPINGGFVIEFKQPADNDLLFIKAVYDLVGGVKGEVQVSYFENKIKVLGFGDTSERTVKVYAVDRSGNLSDPVEVKAKPLVAPVRLVQDSLTISADFGGAKFAWVNRTEAPISIEIFAEDSLSHKLKKVYTVYTSQLISKYSVRNMPSVPTNFAAVVRDRWDNVSDTIRPASGKLTPLFEEKLNKTKMRKVVLASDTKWDAWGFKYENLFDDNFKTTGHTQGDHPWPQIFTIDLGVKTKLSRFRVYQRGPDNTNWFYSHGNPKKYDVYGAAVMPANPDDLTKWQKLRDVCVSTKPSGPGTQLTDEDKLHGINGDEYDFDQVAIPSQIRYFRLVVWETWDGAGYVDFQELTWWGSIIEVYN